MLKKLRGILWVLFLIFIDQISKYAIVQSLKGKEPIAIIKGVFELEYLENRGAAFGILQNKVILFVILTAIVICAIGYVYYKIPEGMKYVPLQFVLVLLTSGAVGNLIDRIRFNYVVDFFYFKLIDFPIFNVADCYVTISAFLMVILFLFYYKDDDLNFISRKKIEKDTPVE